MTAGTLAEPAAVAPPYRAARAARVVLATGLALAAGLAMLPSAAAAAEPSEAPDAETSAAPHASTQPDWTTRGKAIRILAENDVPAAHFQALQLVAELPADAPAAVRAQVHNLLARIEIYVGSSERAAVQAAKALDLASRHQDRAGAAEAHLNIALNAVNQGDIPLLISSSTRSLELLDGVDRPDLLGEALLRTAMMYRRIGQFDESVTMCIQAMEIARRSNDPMVLLYAHQGMGVSFEQSDRVAEARTHFEQMRDQARAAGVKNQEGYALLGIGNTANRLGDKQAAEAHLRQAVALFREVRIPFGIAHGLHTLAGFLTSLGRHAEAQPLLDEVVDILVRQSSKMGQWYAWNSRSSNLLTLGKVEPALADARRAQAVAEELGLPLFLSESALQMAKIAAALGDHRRAYELTVESAQIKAKAEREKSGERMIALAQRYDAELKRRQIDELTHRNALQTAELERQALQQRWLWTVLVGSVLALAATAFLLLRLRQSHRMLESVNAELQRSQDDIRQLNAGLEQRVNERTGELRQQTRYLRTLIDTLPWWVWLKDTESRYLAVNQSAADTCGLSADELVGKCDFDLRPRELAEAYRADDLDVMNSRVGKTVEERQVTDRGDVWMETFKAPVMDEDGTVLGTVGFARDISERKAVEAAREAALIEAQRLARMRSEFLSQMSHELRTPLNGILGYAQILLLDKNVDDRQRAGLEVIRESGEHLLTLINDVLDMAKIEAGKLELLPTDIVLGDFLRSISEIIRVRAERKLLRFACRPADNLPEGVRGDEKRLRQILLNLLANAVKFTERGEVALEISTVAPGRLRFAVRDTGIGIATDRRELIFQPFEQAGELRQRMGGAGLGLAISRQFVRLMGGDIHVESEPGVGSTFWFELDLPEFKPKAKRASTNPVIGYAGPRMTVLLVESAAEARAILVGMLTQLGFGVIEAETGSEAIDKAQAHNPQLILMDAALPGMDGLETTGRLRELGPLREVPIIAMSSGTSGTDWMRCRAAGMNGFLPKPVARDRLIDQIVALTAVEWVYAEPTPSPASPAQPEDAFVAPPAQELDTLHRLALEGNMRDIARAANRVGELDPRYRAFADRLHALANDYQSQSILRLIEHHLNQGAHHEHDLDGRD